MLEAKEALRLRLYAGEYDYHEKEDLYEVVIARAQRLGMAGVTVIKGIAGYRLHPAKLTGSVRTAASRPVVVEIVDTEEHIRRLLATEADLLKGCLVTIEKLEALHLRDGER